MPEGYETHTLSDMNECSSLLSNFNLKILSFNIRSIDANFEEFLIILGKTKTEWNIICLTECFLRSAKYSLEINGYRQFRSERNFNKNDGVVLFVRNDLQITCYESAELIDCTNFTAIINNNTLLVAIYRSPFYKDSNSFSKSLLNYITGNSKYKHIIITGDLNLDILDLNNEKVQSFILGLQELGFCPTITVPTRLASNTCLDHFFLRSKSEYKAAVYHAGITDHSLTMLGVHTSLQTSCHPRRSPELVRTNYNEANKLISMFDWSELYTITNVDDAFKYFTTSIENIINSCTAPMKIRHKDKTFKPWITSSLLCCLRKRDQLHIQAHKNPNDFTIQIYYKNYRNMCKEAVRLARSLYYKDLITKNRQNPKKCWQLLNEYTYAHKKKSDNSDIHKLIKTLKESGNSKPLNEINIFFASVGESLATELMTTTNTNINTLVSQISNKSFSNNFSFFFYPVTEIELAKIIKKLKNTSSPGLDKIPALIIKSNFPFIVDPLLYILNLSLSTGLFPSCLKKSKIVPIFKGGAASDISNFRPISLLSVISKVLEKVAKARLIKFLNKHNLLSKNQFGFQEGKNTEDAILLAVSRIARCLDGGKKSIGIFLDLKKAFDTVAFPILLGELEALGIRGLPLQWFQTYLMDRKQLVYASQEFSDEQRVSYGVPQGSVLGPVLFLTYLNALCDLSLDGGNVISFADDTLLIFTGDTWESTFEFAQKGFTTVMKWLNSKLLTLNKTKTKYICFSIYSNSQPSTLFTLKTCQCAPSLRCHCVNLERVSQIRYLGIIIDQNLSWKPHIIAISKKLRSLIHFFWQLRNIADSSLMWSVYYALAHTVIDYGILAYGGACATTLSLAQPAQNSIIRVINKKPSRYHNEDLYREAGVLNIRQQYMYRLCNYYHNNKHLHKLNTRVVTRSAHVGKLLVDATNTVFGQRFYYWLGPRLYNKIPADVKSHLERNKRACKRWISSIGIVDSEILLKHINK